MDFELLNFWVHHLHFDVRHERLEDNPRLYLSLKAHNNDSLCSYVLLLSESKKDILEFFGYDTSIEYDRLTEKNVFEYLCTSSRLKPQFIQYSSFKGPRAKNKQHTEFNKYLERKEFPRRGSDYCNQRTQLCRIYSQDAVNFFQKEKEYTAYKENRKILDAVNRKTSLVNLKESAATSFSKFIAVHGVLNIATMDDDTFVAAWDKFIKQNWSGLYALGI